MSTQSMHRALNKVVKWRTFFASWQLGSRPEDDGELKAVKHHREATIIQRVELTALTGLLLKKGIFSQQELSDAMEEEATQLELDYQRDFPGFMADHQGLRIIMPEAMETQRRLHFPP